VISDDQQSKYSNCWSLPIKVWNQDLLKPIFSKSWILGVAKNLHVNLRHSRCKFLIVLNQDLLKSKIAESWFVQNLPYKEISGQPSIFSSEILRWYGILPTIFMVAPTIKTTTFSFLASLDSRLLPRWSLADHLIMITDQTDHCGGRWKKKNLAEKSDW